MAGFEEIITVAFCNYLFCFLLQIPGDCKLTSPTTKGRQWIALIPRTFPFHCLVMFQSFILDSRDKVTRRSRAGLRRLCLLRMHRWWCTLTRGWTSCSSPRLIIFPKVKPWSKSKESQRVLPGEEEWTEGSAGWASPSGRRAWCGPRWSPASSVDTKRH